MATIKTMKATLTVTYAVGAVASPMALAASIEEAMKNGKEQLQSIIDEAGATSAATVAQETGVVNMRAPKAAADPVPADPVPLETAIEVAPDAGLFAVPTPDVFTPPAEPDAA